jgi:signal transduction histidine kinase
MSDGVLDPRPAVIHSLHEESVLLGSLVDDLQDLAMADAGQLVLDREPCDIRAVISQSISAFASRAADRQIALMSQCGKDLATVFSDRRRIAQVLRNLIENALTHTPSGGTISVRADSVMAGGAARSGDWIEVQVSDTGAGISPQDLPHVFDRFYRADRSRTRATGGSGLGLAIAKQFVEAHGGQISASSEIGAGATFRFTLPAASDVD